MDPDVTLKEMLEAAESILKKEYSDQTYALCDQVNMLETQAETLAQLALHLNDWIIKGGFLPKEWRN